MTKLRVKPEDVAITAKGTVVEGKAATAFATLLLQRNDHVVKVVQELDSGVEAKDFHLDEAGRLVVKSERIQQMVFEAVRSGSKADSPKRLGKLVKLTGGRIGTRILDGEGAEGAESDEAGTPDPPPVRGETHLHEVNFFCWNGAAIDLFCGEFDDTLEADETDVNCFCGWSS